MQIPIIQGSKVDVSDSHTIAKYPINTYAKEGKMRSVAGLRHFSSLNGMDRNGFFINTGVLKGHFRIAGKDFIEVDKYGTISYPDSNIKITGDDRVKYDATIANLIFCADGKYYLYNKKEQIRNQTVTTPPVSNPPKDPPPIPVELGKIIDLIWIKQFVILLATRDITDKAGKTVKATVMWQSEPQQDAVFTRGYGIDDTDPDQSVAIASESDFFILFNKKTITFWYPRIADQSKFSFLPAESKQIDGGIVGRDCKARLGNTWAILSINVPSQDPNIYLLGSTLQPIGSFDIQSILKTYSEDEFLTAVLESHQYDGIDMLYVHLSRHVLLYNAQTQLWVILESTYSDFKKIPYRAINIVDDERTNQLIVGDKIARKLGVMDQKKGDQYGYPITQVMYTGYMFFNLAIRHLVLTGNFGQWEKDKAPLLKIQLSQSGIAFGPTLTTRFPDFGDYNSLVSLRNLGFIRGKATLRIEITSAYSLELDDKLSINETADGLVNA